MNYNTKYFVVNLVINGFFNWFPEREQVVRLSYVILEVREDVLGDGKYYYYNYTGFRFKGIHIKKLLSAKNVCGLISTCRSYINFSKSVPESLTDEDILSMVRDNIFDLITISTKSKLYSYNI